MKKKYIALAALLAAGTTFANAEETLLTVSTPWFVSGCVGVYHGFQINFDSVKTLGTGSSAESDYAVPEGEYSIETLSVALDSYSSFSDDTKWDAGEDTALVVLNGDNKIQAISGTASLITSGAYGTQSQKAMVSFSFDDFDYSTADGTLKVFFVSSTESLSVGGDLSNELLAKARFIGSTYDSITGVTANKSIDGSFGSMTPCIQYTMSKIPEPSAFGLLAGIGALALVASRRRRK